VTPSRASSDASNDPARVGVPVDPLDPRDRSDGEVIQQRCRVERGEACEVEAHAMHAYSLRIAAVTTDLATLQDLVAVTGRVVVDVGCGGGWLARELGAAGARVTALEISDGQLAGAREADDGRTGVIYAVGRAEQLPLPDASQDVVVFMRSLHHVPIVAMGDALSQARRVLAPGGAVYIAEPLPEGDWFELQSLIEVETETRAAAQAAIGACAAQGLTRTWTERYVTETWLADADAFRRRMLAVDPARREILNARDGELRHAFRTLGIAADGGRRFTHGHQADVLREL
jgi:ubiquinone/menaquinone biosynthesis C-methylase UbiE